MTLESGALRSPGIRLGLAALLLLTVGPIISSSADPLSPAGTLDVSFADGGYVVTDLGGLDSVTAMSVDSTIVILADSYPNGGALLRYRMDGSLDPAFSGDGIRQLQQAVGCCGGIYVDSYGAVLVLTTAVGPLVTLSRYLPNGDPDPAFGTGGRVELTGVFPRDMAVQADGEIVLVGETSDVRDVAVLKFDRSGAPDPTFSKDGLATFNLGTVNDFGWHVEALPSGKILVLASRTRCPPCRTRGYLLRLRPTGSLDPTFGNEGMVWWRFRNQEPIDMALAGVRVIVLMGQYGVWGCPSGGFGLIEFRRRGAVARGFSDDGRFWGGRIDASAVAVQMDGHILVSGNHCATGWPPDFAIERFTSSGQSDPEFGRRGLSAPRLGSLDTRAAAMALDPAGNIILAGDSLDAYGDEGDIVVARYLGT